MTDDALFAPEKCRLLFTRALRIRFPSAQICFFDNSASARVSYREKPPISAIFKYRFQCVSFYAATGSLVDLRFSTNRSKTRVCEEI